jgi:hypothetical protein
MMEQMQTKWSKERQRALEMAQKLKHEGVEPDAEYTAAAGPDYGWVKVWKVEGGYVVYWGDSGDSCAVLEEDIDLDDIDGLAAWIEWGDCVDLDAIVRRANVRGADAVPEADQGSEGPFYVLETRQWYGATETSDVILDESGRGPLEFETYEQAREWINAADDDVYRLSHNESSRPSYKVIAVE